MNYPNVTTVGMGVSPVPMSELQMESSELEKAIQQMFDTSQELLKRLQPVLSQYPSAPSENQKNPEEAMSEFGSKLRSSRRSVEEINGALCGILTRLAL